MLEVKTLRKTFGSTVAVDGVSLRAGRGETVGLLGPNGAGKTTTVSLIAGLLRPDSGTVLIAGRPLGGDTDPIKRQIGLVPQDLALYDELSALDNLTFFAALYDLDGAAAKEAIAGALDLVGLTDRARDKVREFSGGMKRRLNLAAALLHDPQILLLDEPTVGVDPQSRNAIFDNLETLKLRGKTLVYTTHYMEEAERLCDRIIIIDHGKVIANDRLAAVRRLVPEVNLIEVEIENPGSDGWYGTLRGLAGVETVELQGNLLRVGMGDLTDTAPDVLEWIRSHGYRYTHLATQRADLETVFLTLTGRSVRNA